MRPVRRATSGSRAQDRTDPSRCCGFQAPGPLRPRRADAHTAAGSTSRRRCYGSSSGSTHLGCRPGTTARARPRRRKFTFARWSGVHLGRCALQPGPVPPKRPRAPPMRHLVGARALHLDDAARACSPELRRVAFRLKHREHGRWIYKQVEAAPRGPAPAGARGASPDRGAVRATGSQTTPT